MEDSGDDLGLEVPLNVLMKEFDCAICYNLLSDTFMTPCGHNFCRKCIAECLNRKHICPLCNKADVTMNLCHPNLQMDNFLAILQKEKDDASKRYFNRLLTKSSEGGGVGGAVAVAAGNPSSAAPSKFSPVEALFQKHMRKSLAEFTAYHGVLVDKREAALQRLRVQKKKIEEKFFKKKKNQGCLH